MKILYRHSKAFSYFALFLLVLFAYFSSFYAPPLWDDNFFIFENKQIVSNNNPFIFFNPFIKDHRAWPLGYTIFWFLYQAFGVKWTYYKLLNIIIHFLNVVLVHKLANKYIKQFSIIPAIFFAIHPLQVETVSWIFQLNTMLASTGVLLSILFWYKYNSTNRYVHLFLSIAAFLLSSFIKSYGVLLPIYLYYICTFKGLKKFLTITPFLLISALASFSTLRGIASSPLENKNQINHQVNADQTTVPYQKVIDYKDDETIKEETSKIQIDKPANSIQSIPDVKLFSNEQVDLVKENKPHESPITSFSKESFSNIIKLKNIFINRVILISNNFSYYVLSFLNITQRLLFAPNHDKSSLTVAIFSIFISFTFFTVFIFAILFKKYFDQESRSMLLLLLCSFVPISGIHYIPFMKYSPVSDHWVYLCLVPGSILFFFFIQKIIIAMNLRKYFNDLRFIFAVPIVFFTISTFRYGIIFNDHEILFLTNINANPQSVFLYRYLSRFYQNQSQTAEARKILEQGLMLHPSDIGLIIDWNNINK